MSTDPIFEFESKDVVFFVAFITRVYSQMRKDSPICKASIKERIRNFAREI